MKASTSLPQGSRTQCHLPASGVQAPQCQRAALVPQCQLQQRIFQRRSLASGAQAAQVLLCNLQQRKLQSHLPALGVVAAPFPHRQVQRGRLQGNASGKRIRGRLQNGTSWFQQSQQRSAASVLAIATTIAQLGKANHQGAPIQLWIHLGSGCARLVSA